MYFKRIFVEGVFLYFYTDLYEEETPSHNANLCYNSLASNVFNFIFWRWSIMFYDLWPWPL